MSTPQKSPRPTTPSEEKAATDNRSRQLDRENDAYWQSRGEPGRPATPPDEGAAPGRSQPNKK